MQNPDIGKFCRSCGTDLGNLSEALSGKLSTPQHVVDRKGRPVSWERAIVKIFSGLAFIAVSIALAFTNVGRGWWFWMLIPAFMSLGAGIAQYVQLKKAESSGIRMTVDDRPVLGGSNSSQVLPAPTTEYVSPETRYKTGDLVPPSVTETTTRHLELDHEGQTMTLPKK
jgi:hypothetical protein